MLTDYHLHLRPDDLDATAAEHFTPPTSSATARSPASAGSPSWGSPSTSTASARRSRCGSTRFWRENALDDLDDYCRFVREETDLRLGIEADFVPGAEDRTANLLEARDFDYVVGSVHFLRDESLDMEEYGDLEHRAAARRRSGGATSRRSARRRAAACSTSSPTPTS